MNASSLFRLGFSHPRFRLAWLLVAFGLLGALPWMFVRWSFENSYTQTQLTLDFEDTRSLADAYGMPQQKLLQDFRERGVTSLVLPEQTLGSLRDNGRLAISPREVAEKAFSNSAIAALPADYRYIVTSSDAALLERVAARLQTRAEALPRPRVVDLGDASGIAIGASKQLLGDVALGLDPQQIKMARDNDMTVTARLLDPINLSPESLDALLDDAEEAGARVMMMGETEVLGYETLIEPVAREMRERGLLFTLVEFGKQSGAGDFAKATEGQLVRVHGITADEAVKAQPEVVIDRFTRAAKDRNMRVLLLRFLRQQRGEPVELENGERAPLRLEIAPYQQNLDFVEEISRELKRQPLPISVLRPGLQMAPAQAFGDYPDALLEPLWGPTGARIARYLMLWVPGLGVVGLTLLVLNLVLDLSPSAARKWLFAGILLVTGLSASHGIGAKLMSLQAGILVPVVAILWGGLPLIWDGLSRPDRPTLGATWKLGFATLARTTFFVLIGSVLIIALLNHWRYMSKADEFLGEKATQWLPLLIVPLLFIGRLFPHRVAQSGALEGRQRLGERFRFALGQSFNVKTVAIGFTVLIVAYVWMARFGNESGMTISPVELALRNTLEQVFIARPRTKEIFLGHPAFLAVVLCALARKPILALAALVPATIGVADVLNTMCHIHTPLFYSIWRTLVGLVIGGATGAFLLWFLWRFLKIRPVLDDETPVNGANGHADGVVRVRENSNFVSS